ncbi:MAG: ABC transporter ATP-binding protein/permease, partial [Fimbriimonadaceae bacterium]|nr:ABC transporter ATP-binding protein/permease [Alphaproteobacteria bacterium]
MTKDNSRRQWLLLFVRPELPRLFLVLILSAAVSGLGLAQPWITKILIDDGLVAGDFSIIATMCAVMLAAAISAAVLSAFNRWHYVSSSSRILFALRASVYRHLQKLSPEFYTRIRGGDMMARLDGDVAIVQRFAVDSALALVNGLFVLIGALALMIGLSWQLSLAAFLLLPGQIIFLRWVRPIIEDKTRNLREQASGITSFFFDTLSTMKFIQSTASEPREAAKLDRLQDTYFYALRHLQMVNQASSAIPSLMTLLGTIIVFLIGGKMVIDQTLTIGSLIAFTAYMVRATGPVQTLLGLYVAMKRAEVSLERVEALTREVPAVIAPERPQPFAKNGIGELFLERVSFRYAGQAQAVFSQVDAVFEGGKKIAITGMSGVGKTTLVDLLQRHFDPTGGRILFDGIDLKNLNLAELRRRIAVVGQETVLFSGTVRENLRYAAPNASESEIMEAAKRAQIDQFVEALPEGFDTEIGTRGMTLSGGQRQRIAIARALLMDPLVLILDEATSGIDEETETRIRVAVDELFSNRTRLIITHHSALADDADLVFK